MDELQDVEFLAHPWAGHIDRVTLHPIDLPSSLQRLIAAAQLCCYGEAEPPLPGNHLPNDSRRTPRKCETPDAWNCTPSA